MWCIISAVVGAVFVVIAIGIAASTTTTNTYFGP